LVPTFEVAERFWKDHAHLTAQEKLAFADAVEKLIEDLARGQLRAGLRVKRVRGTPGVFELTWAPDGRATFEYGAEVREGEPHIIWRRIGGHDIFSQP
jgi:hypothetical protein